MNVLIDTHILIWIDTQIDALSSPALEAISDEENTLLISHASIWEMQIKVDLGKLSLKGSIADMLDRVQKNYHLQLLSITLDHIYTLSFLPHHHGDPFDRMVIAQATFEKVAVVTKDAQIARYPVRVIW